VIVIYASAIKTMTAIIVCTRLLSVRRPAITEAIYEFDLKDMPVTVAVYVDGKSVHKTGPQIWKQKIELKNI